MKGDPPLNKQQRRAVWAITHCRTVTLGGHRYTCESCGKDHYQYHSCNHRSCPQCGRLDTAKWVVRQMQKRIDGATYYMVTFTLPCELRSLFFGPFAKTAFDLFFKASSAALKEKLTNPKYLGAATSGFIGVLHTWDQKLLFHPHIHYIVPATGIDSDGQVIISKGNKYLVNIDRLKGAFRDHLKRLLADHQCDIDPQVWRMSSHKWAINIQSFGDGKNAIKYLGRYVCRTAIGDSRILCITDTHVTFSHKDRTTGKQLTTTITGIEFVKRYLRHVLPPKLRSIRYSGFMHPAASKNHQRIVEHHTQLQINSGALSTASEKRDPQLEALLDRALQKPVCSECDKEMVLTARLSPTHLQRPKPRGPPPKRHRTKVDRSIT